MLILVSGKFLSRDRLCGRGTASYSEVILPKTVFNIFPEQLVEQMRLVDVHKVAGVSELIHLISPGRKRPVVQIIRANMLIVIPEHHQYGDLQVS